jgi:hypothetical protein
VYGDWKGGLMATATRERPLRLGDVGVRLVLDVLKTQTRRPFKPGQFECPFAAIGEKLWVREAFQIESNRNCEIYDEPEKPLGPVRWHYDDDHGNWFECPRYRASEPDCELLNDDGKPIGWRPSIHMPRWACRLLLDVLDVRLEPVAAISDDDAIAEGVKSPRVFQSCWRKIYGDEATCWAITFAKAER